MLKAELGGKDSEASSRCNVSGGHIRRLRCRRRRRHLMAQIENGRDGDELFDRFSGLSCCPDRLQDCRGVARGSVLGRRSFGVGQAVDRLELWNCRRCR